MKFNILLSLAEYLVEITKLGTCVGVRGIAMGRAKSTLSVDAGEYHSDWEPASSKESVRLDPGVKCRRPLEPKGDCPKGERRILILIDGRVLTRESLRICIAAATDADVQGFESVSAWLSHKPDGVPSLFLVSFDHHSSPCDQTYRDIDALAQAATGVPVAVIADGDHLEAVLEALQYGVRGYIPTSTSPAVAIEAIELILAGGTYVPASSLLQLRSSDEASISVNRKKLSMFTARQSAVIEALRKGKANKTIAYELSMRESTVKVHVRNIMKRLNAKNRTEVAYLAGQLIDGEAV